MSDESLPIDPDVVSSRPVHLRARYIALVLVGGMLGTFTRYLLALAVPPWGSVPVAIFGINVVGAFVLGWLIEGLARRGSDTGARRAWRLFAGTGILGGFTTYSALAVDADGLIAAGQGSIGMLYAVVTVIVGAAASAAGIALASRGARR